VKQVLFFATTTGYQTRMFSAAAERLGIRLLFVTDRCDQIEDPWADGAIPVRFHMESIVADAVLDLAERTPIAGLLAVGDRPTVAAAYAARALGLPGNPPDAARAARDKRIARERVGAAGLPVPEVRVISRHSDPHAVAHELTFPIVVKPAVLSGSRGVIRADSAAEFVAAVSRVSRLLDAPDIRELHEPAADDLLVESYIPGREFAIEAVMEHGICHTLAVFDKPDPLDGPYFEETLYVTPSRATSEEQAAITRIVGHAARAIGLRHGPVHAECRLNDRGVYILEVAARPIGGLCAQALAFIGPDGTRASLEELLLRLAVGESVQGWRREREASGVMMIPIPGAGVYRRVRGIDEARRVPGIWNLQITAKTDQQLVPLPEGASYLGFIFARADRPEQIEQALRDAHARLEFTIDRPLPLAAR
jgi:biotin carboxylase